MFPSFTRDRDRDRNRNRQAPRRRGSRPALEALEGKQLLSIGPEMIAPVNTKTANAQIGTDNATSVGGESVVVWTDTWSATDTDIRAQRYNAFGGKLGPEIIVAFSSLREYDPAVAMNDRGQFVVTYTQQVGADTNIMAQRFDSNGNILGAPIQVGAGTFKEHDADVAMDGQGNFVVSYTRDTNNNNPDVFAKRYDANGNLLQVINVAVSAPVQDFSSVAMTPDGRFDVAFEQAFSTTDHDIYVNRYTASGALANAYTVAFTTARDQRPSIAMDTAGDSVVAWDSNSAIRARRISAAGVMGNVINVSTSTSSDMLPSVALNQQGGGFVVAYFSSSATVGNVTKVAEVSAFDRVTTYTIGTGTNTAFQPSVSIDAFGNYLLSYSRITTTDFDVFARRGRLLF